MDEKDLTIQELKREISRWRGRAIEAAEEVCNQCRIACPDACRNCRMKKIRQEAGYERSM
jgi:hypothetical protein